MHSTYDPRARAMAIGLVDDTHHDRTADVSDTVTVGLRDGTPVMVEIIGLGYGDDELRIAQAADAFDLDRPAILAAFRAATAAPGRRVSLTVAA